MCSVILFVLCYYLGVIYFYFSFILSFQLGNFSASTHLTKRKLELNLQKFFFLF